MQESIENDALFILIKEYEAKVYTTVILLKQHLEKEVDDVYVSVLSSGFDLLIDMEKEKHYYLGEKNSDTNKHRRKVNRIENFWGYAKSRLTKFKGMHSSTFNYHMKECEFRYNNRDKDLYQYLLKILRKDPLF